MVKSIPVHRSPAVYATIAVLLLNVFVRPSPSSAYDFSKSADLRQNALVMSWPGRDRSTSLPRGSFGISETKVRLRGRIASDMITFNTAVETSASFASSADNLFTSGGLFGKGSPLEHWDATGYQIDEATTTLRTRLERFDIRLAIGRYDIDLGRQPVSLGTSHFVGVLDVLAPFAPGDLDATYKPGIDALRIRRGIGIAGEAEIIAAGAAEWSDGAILGRFRHGYGGFDFEWVGGRFRHRGFGGIGWEGEAWDNGFWGEIALFERHSDEQIFGGNSDVAFSGVAGVDVSLPQKFKLGVSGMYQDFGVRDPDDLVKAYSSAPLREGWLFLASAGYGVVTLHRELHPLVQGDLAGIVNLVDRSTIWQPRITVSTGNDTDVAFYGWVGTGAGPVSSGETIRMKSEFGGTPNGGGFYARWFF